MGWGWGALLRRQVLKVPSRSAWGCCGDALGWGWQEGPRLGVGVSSALGGRAVGTVGGGGRHCRRLYNWNLAQSRRQHPSPGPARHRSGAVHLGYAGGAQGCCGRKGQVRQASLRLLAWAQRLAGASWSVHLVPFLPQPPKVTGVTDPSSTGAGFTRSDVQACMPLRCHCLQARSG